ncbi:MAG TPA: PRC-barrel domain-containing protein, partial [Anaerolineaceae bacterium]|nr:PRC-barrel domain-containing protein [Anaerolineaceae bacterium]
MVESRWEMKIGSPVMATDGEYGHLQEVIVDPQQGRVVALLVRKHGLLTPHIVVVPEQEVADASDNEVRLKISQEQINALLEYKPGAKLIVEGQKYELDDKSFAVRGTQGFQVGRSPTERQPGMIESQFDQSERESLAIQLQPGKKVFCRDGHAGKVSLILLNPDGRVKGFVMDVDAEHPLDVDGGHLLGRSLIVPIERVQEVDKDYVHLSIDKSALENLLDYS